MDIRFDNRVVLVSGGAQGIGRTMATAFRDSGARVHLVDRDLRIEDEGTALGVPAHVVDLSDRAASHALVQAIARQEGRLDILALAAGGLAGLAGLPLEEVTDESARPAPNPRVPDRAKRPPGEALVDPCRLPLLPSRDPARAEVIARAAQAYGISASMVYRSLRELTRPKPVRRADHGTTKAASQAGMERYAEIAAALKVRTSKRRATGSRPRWERCSAAGASHHAVIPSANTVGNFKAIWPRLSGHKRRLSPCCMRSQAMR